MNISAVSGPHEFVQVLEKKENTKNNYWDDFVMWEEKQDLQTLQNCKYLKNPKQQQQKTNQ